MKRHEPDPGARAHVEVPGLETPWPDARRYPVVRRLLALWRWEWERGPDSEAATNARRSLVDRTAGMVEEGTWTMVEEDTWTP